MLLGALIDAGAPLEDVRHQLEVLELGTWSLDVEQVTRAGLRALSVGVQSSEPQRPRSLHDIESLLQGSALHPDIAATATRVFRLLGEAEAHVHGVDIEQVHFHEVGALDAIVDVVGVIIAARHVASRVVCSPLPAGSGRVGTMHGSVPVPAPAVAEICIRRGVPLVGDGEGEVTTPTGAALVAVLAKSFGAMPAMTLRSTGYGAGERDRSIPNVVRALVGDELDTDAARHEMLLLETNIDDMTPELVPYVMERLLDAGAADAWVTPIVMKKGRPASILSVLVDPSARDKALEVLFRETTTLGVRMTHVARRVLDRDVIEVIVQGHVVRVKVGLYDGEVVTLQPEHEDAAAAARATGLALKDVYAAATRAARSNSNRSTL